MLGQVLEMAEKLDVPEQATLPVYVKDIYTIMDIGRYCQDVRLGNSTRRKRYFTYYQPPAHDDTAATVCPMLQLRGSEVAKLGGAGETTSFKKCLRVAHDGPLESLEQRLMIVEGDL